MGIICEELRASAKGQACTLQISGVCCGDRDTVVLCHAPAFGVRGTGSKGHDFFAAFGCRTCHDALDQHRIGREDELFYWLRGVMRTLEHWIEAGLVTLPVDPATAKRRPKKKAKLPSRTLRSRNDLKGGGVGFGDRGTLYRPIGGDEPGE